MKSRTFPGQNDAVFNAYTPFRNSIRKASLTSSLRAIHAHIQHMQFGQPIPLYIKNAPTGYENAKTTRDFLSFHVWPWELEIMTKELIIHGDYFGRRKTIEDWNYLANTVNKLKNLEDNISKIYITKDNVLLEIHRIAHRQFTWQSKPGLEEVARYWKIYSDSKLNAVILKAIGLSLDEIYLIALALTGVYLEEYALFYPPKINVKHIKQEHLEKFLKHFSLSINQLREKLISELQMNEKYAYAFNSLRAFPLIKMEYEGREALVCPLPTLLFRRITEGLYYEICKEPNFDSSFGDSFQKFIGEMLKRSNKKVKTLDEKSYGKPEKRTVDWIVVDDDVLLFVECKGKRLTLEAKISLLDTNEFYKQLDLMADFIVQLYKTILDYEAGKYPHLKFDKNKKVFPILVTLEEWFLFGNTGYDTLNKKVEDKLTTLGISLKVLKNKPYMVCSVEGLDMLMQVSKDHRPDKILRKKYKDAETRTWHLDTYLQSKYKKAVNKVQPLFKDELSRHIDYKL